MTHASAILTIDLGTTACKVALVAPDGTIIASVEQADATPTNFLPGGGAEQDPAIWWEVITHTVRRLWQESHFPRERVAAVACSAHWSGTVAVDADGQPLGPAILWMDTRGAPHVDQITGGWPSIEGYGLGRLLTWLRLTGGIPTYSGKDPIAHILFLKQERPEVFHEADCFLEPTDYLNLRMTGRKAASYASITLHWLTDNRDIDQVDYHPTLLRWSGIPREKLPDLFPNTHILGPLTPQAAEALDLPATVPVVIGAPDLHAAMLGSGALTDYEPHIYIGTSSWLTCHVPFKKTDLFHNMASLPSAVPGRYFIANEQESAGVCMTFLRDKLFYADDGLTELPPPHAYSRFDLLAASTPAGARGVRFTPWLVGERTPVEDPALRGAFLNLSLSHTRADLIRAVLEGVALNMRWLMRYIERFIRRPLGAIRMVGGGAQSDLWCQIFADVLQKPILQVEAPLETGVRGVGLLAAVALQMTTFEKAAQRVRIAHKFAPNPDHRAVYDQAFEEFLQAHRQLQSLYHRWNRG